MDDSERNASSGGEEPPEGPVGDDRAGAAATAVRDAIAAAGVGEAGLPGPLAAIDGLGAVAVEDGVATVSVSLPVPAADLRRRIAEEVRAAAGAVAGVRGVDVAFAPSAADAGEDVELLPDVSNVVAVASGKGGVGKSTVAANLAVALADAGAAVGLLDADVYGPNAPAMLGLDDRTPSATDDDEMVPRTAHGVDVLSMGFVAGEDDPVIWRGPLVDEFIKQLFGDGRWGDLDYLVVDMPPGTGDAQLSLVQHLPVAGAVVVTTPQEVAVDDAARGLVGFARYDVPVLGVVENMAGFACPDCGEVHEIFGSGGAEDLAAQFEVPVLGRIPLHPAAGPADHDESDGDAPGVDVPLVGRLQLPRTREERGAAGTRPPLAIREDGGEPREALRDAATSVAARVNEAAVELDR